ncbi:cytochrome c biogenesis protein DipZ [Duganella sp. BJB488]|uniref:cytochrome c biogenesis protein DipZ n=1 Tax=unclassified Duganella TaxID=2636909 RepID=UPI000E34C7B0|nr:MULTISPECIES: cytochrome c biogenesis protein DipZ [unclassified Duganella]RFP20201.1 cytochrome c biogenesis protein DipZ [Duganella sp. BJB489]RFP21351.1 cytochrome c biogenesis protein DipZ [Duganella sp. BJB488]RFP33492.1 cytochrome c biogenesis protein DipZ [Duganella sp. BJB480]
MLLILLSYLGGALTILSPCILPVLPFVFARTGQPFVRSALPLLAGMALTFALVATLAAVGGGWVVQANQYGRWLAMALMAFFALTLMLPHLADRLTKPLVALGDRLSSKAQAADGAADSAWSGARSSFLLGIATGLLWAPCAGPVLGLLLTGAALNGASAQTTLLLLAYAAGAATSLALALLIGGKVFSAMKRSLGAGEWMRRGLGVAILGGVAAIASGLDTGLLTRVSTVATSGLEQKLIDTLSPREPRGGAMMAGGAMRGGDAANGSGAMMSRTAMSGNGPAMMAMHAAAPAEDALPVEGKLPPLTGAVDWLNSAPLTAAQLKGKVVLVDFWTYSCINCLRSMPYVKAWAEKYRDQGLVVIGVHAPEFAFERDIGNVRKAVKDLGITYPVAVDNDYAIWRAFGNQYWPAHYLIDAKGQIRHHHFGEGEYAQTEQAIQQLLEEAGRKNVANTVVSAEGAQGVQQASDMGQVASPETYLGYERAQNFASPETQAADKSRSYTAPAQPALNQWGLAGNWLSQPDQVTLSQGTGRIVYRFHARDLHLVLGPDKNGKPVRFRVTIDGAAPGRNHGADVAADGSGTINGQRLYQLVRQSGSIGDHTFNIEFLDPGVQAYAFTFG